MIEQKFRLRRYRVEKVLNKGKSTKIGNFIVRYQLNKQLFNRFSIVMSRKFEKLATIRNRKKRQVYEAIRNIIKEGLAKNEHFDLVLIPYKKILSCNYNRIYQNVNDIFKYLNQKS